MTEPKSPRLTFHDVKSLGIADLVDALLDTGTVRAGSIIRQLDRHRVDLALFHAVRSVDPRWRFPKHPITPIPSVRRDQAHIRSIARTMCASLPEEDAMSVFLGVGDALDDLVQDRRRI